MKYETREIFPCTEEDKRMMLAIAEAEDRSKAASYRQMMRKRYAELKKDGRVK